MSHRWSTILVLAGLCGFPTFILTTSPSDAQASAGAKFGSRDPRKAATAREYFICYSESIEGPNASGDFINLVDEVKVEFGRSRPFDPNTDTFGFTEINQIDPAQPVVPIRGRFNKWMCGKLGQINAAPGKSCNLTSNLRAVGLCFTSSFGDWHCTMYDLGRGA